MQWELGPFPADDVQHWSRTARRVMLELRAVPDTEAGPAPLDDDLLDSWGRFIERWATEATRCDGPFRWSDTIDDDQAEFLLHGLEQCLHHPQARCSLTCDEIARHRRFTVHLVEALIDGLQMEGRSSEHFADQLRAVGT